MMDTTTRHAVHFGWFEAFEIALFVILVPAVIALVMFFMRNASKRFMERIPSRHTGRENTWTDTPEVLLLMLGLPLELLWEIAHFPLYTVWHEGDWGYILYGLVHCTLGDLMILLSIFWIVSLLERSRQWIFSPTLTSVVLFTFLGVGYTIFSEIVNTRIKGTWGYTESMPIIPVVEIGGTPFLQWLLIPPVLIWLLRLVRQSSEYRPAAK